MLAKRIIPCLDVKDGEVVKGVRFRGHERVGDMVPLARRYAAEGADELVFYDISASAEGRTVDLKWISDVARVLDIPFAVAGGIRSVESARQRLESGADKISINSPALERPDLIDELVETFGSQCIVIGVDSWEQDGSYRVHQYTGDEASSRESGRETLPWIAEVIDRGAGEIVLNCMNQDGVRQGYDISQLAAVREVCSVPLIASGGAGEMQHFRDVFREADVDGALAASVFHKQVIAIPDLKAYLASENIEVRP